MQHPEAFPRGVVRLEATYLCAMTGILHLHSALRWVALILLVVTFIAILELVRLKRLTIVQNQSFSDFQVDRVQSPQSETSADAGSENELETSSN